MEFTVERPLPPKQLHPNGGGKWHWGMIARLKKETRLAACYSTLEVFSQSSIELINGCKYDVHLRFYLKSKRSLANSDENNMGEWAKADTDGISDAMDIDDKHFKSPTVELLVDPDRHESRRLVITIRREK